MLTALFLLALFVQRSLSQCQDGWAPYIQGDKCVKAFTAQHTFIEAMQYCQTAGASNGGSLVSIHNAFQNAQLGSLAQQESTECPYWIGLYDFDGSNEYKWVDGTDMDYSDWAPGYPAGNVEETAAFMNTSQRNRWEETLDLSAKYCFFCQQKSIAETTTAAAPATTAAAGQCENGWTFFNGYCYLYNTNLVHEAQAEKTCITKAANLISVHSAAENTFVTQQVAPTGYKGHTIWLGIKYESKVWEWHDGTPFDYHQWLSEPQFPTTNPCALANPSGWYNTLCDSIVEYPFVCKKKAA